MRRRGRRPWLAGIFAFLILLINVFPVVVLAQPYVPNLGGTDLQIPDLQAPDWETPQLENPQWEIPDLQQPPVSPSVLEPPHGELPSLQPPGGNPPALNPGGGEAPDSEPFGESLPYKMMELSIKDLFGGTLAYSSQLLESGTVTAGQGGLGYANLLLQVGVKGLDIGLQDTPWGNVTGLAVDGLGAKGAYDSYKFVTQQGLSTLNGGVNAQRSFTNGVQGAANTVRVPGLITGLNVGVAAISLPFDAFNTFSKFDQAFDPNRSEDEQNEKFVDGVGSLGSTLIDAGIIASVVPGGQTVGTVLVVTGAVLWAGSALVKWANKATGGALTRGIRKGVEKAVGWVKSIFSFGG